MSFVNCQCTFHNGGQIQIWDGGLDLKGKHVKIDL